MKKIGEILLEKGLITEQQLKDALEKQSKMEHKKRIGELLIEEGLLSYDMLLRYLDIQIKEKS